MEDRNLAMMCDMHGTHPHGSLQSLFGFNVDPLRMDQVIEYCREAIAHRSSLLLGVLNAAKVVKAHKDLELRESLLSCDLLLADGQSIVWASKLLKQPLPERVTGIDVFEQLLGLAHREGLSVYLLGAQSDVLERLESRVQAEYPGLKVAGKHHGYFDESDSTTIANDIRKSGADMLFLGISSPKKEKFLALFKDTLDVPVMHGVGGSFDILAGVTKRAPQSWQRAGMEWAFRVIQEPRRMWWRYMSTNLGFVILLAWEIFKPSPAFRADHGGRLHAGKQPAH